MQRKQYTLLAATGIALLAVAVVGTAVGLGGVGAESPSPPADEEYMPADRSITVSATGGAEAAPDRAEIDLAVTAEGANASDVRDDLAVSGVALREELDERGVEYETTDYEVHSPPQRFQEERDVAAYIGSHEFAVSVEDPDRVGAVIDAAAEAGAQIEDVELTLSEDSREQLREQAIANAMDDARNQAETIANASDLAVTAPSTVDAAQHSYNPVSYETAEDAGDASVPSDRPTQIDAGDVSVTYEVQVTYNATAAMR